jgi:hypothetical protein
MRTRKKYLLLTICLSLFNCLSYNNNQPTILIDVVIENNTSETLFTGEFSGHSLHYGKDTKNYSLVMPIYYDTSSISMDCYNSLYIYDVVILPKNKLSLKIDIFPINNEKYTFILDEHYGIIEKLEDDPYNDDEINFLMYYTKESFNIQYYKNYVEHIKINGYPLIGHIKNGIVYFVINE